MLVTVDYRVVRERVKSGLSVNKLYCVVVRDKGAMSAYTCLARPTKRQLRRVVKEFKHGLKRSNTKS